MNESNPAARTRTRSHREGNAVAVLFLLALLATTNAGAAGLACKPDVKFKNLRATALKVVQFGYKDGDGDVHSEGLVNKKLARNEAHTWKNQTLQHVADGNPVTAIRFRLRDDTSGQGNPSSPWGSRYWTLWYTRSGDCTASTTYYHEHG